MFLPSWSLGTNRQQHIPFQQHFKAACDLLPPRPVCVFFHLNNSLGNKWFNFKIPSWSVYTIIPFPTCSPTGYFKPIMLEFYHVLGKGGCLVSKLTNLPNLSIIFPSLFNNILYTTWTSPSLDVCAHIPLTLWVSTSYVVFMAMNALEPMM